MFPHNNYFFKKFELVENWKVFITIKVYINIKNMNNNNMNKINLKKIEWKIELILKCSHNVYELWNNND